MSTGIAFVSLALSLFVLWRQHQATGRAHFTAEWEDVGSLVYVNHGPGPAKNVEVVLASTQPKERHAQSTPYIGAFQATRLGVTRLLGEELGPLTISWTDNRRQRQEATVYLPRPPSGRGRVASNVPDVVKAIQAIAHDETVAEINAMIRRERRSRL